MATILVTQADVGLGADLAVGLAQDGHRVAAASPSGAPPAGTTGDLLVEPIVIDLAGPDSIRQGVDRAATVFGGLDVVILNGEAGPLVPLEHLPAADLARLVDINLVGPIHLVQAALPRLRASGDGRVVAISTLAAAAALPASGACSAVRSGLEAALQAWRYELLPDGIDISVLEIAYELADADARPHRHDGAYGALLAAAADVRRRASRASHHDLVLDAMRRILATERPDFRHTLSGFAALAADLRAADETTLAAEIGHLYRLDEWLVKAGG